MFTGLIQATGTVVTLETAGDKTRLQVAAPQVAAASSLGDSIAVNGCCLTISSGTATEMIFDLLGETLERTNLKTLRAGAQVNLERALAAGAPLGGHFVQGHIDCAAPILALEERGADLWLEIELPPSFAPYVIPKGSIAVDGISLTVAEVSEKSFAVWIIPHTKMHTNLGQARTGDLVNLEFDLLAKYVERMLEHRVVRPK